MHRLNELAEQLTPAQIREVEAYAESLLTRPQVSPTIVRDGMEYLNPAAIEAAAAMLAGLPLDKSSVELQHEALAVQQVED